MQVENCQQTEDQCQYVSTIGIALVAQQKLNYVLIKQNWLSNYQRALQYQFNFDNEHGEIVYVKSSHLPEFFKSTLHRFKQPIFIISNEDDNIFPLDFTTCDIENNPKLAGLFIQNNYDTDMKNKVYHIPIGIDYHTLNWNRGQHVWGTTQSSALQQEQILLQCRKQMLPIQDCRTDVVLTNFQLAMTTPPRRQAIREPLYDALKDQSWMIWLPEMSRQEFWMQCKDCAFVLCPPGNGPDTHRTWEVLMLGRIPIIEDLPINEVYKELPVWVISDLKTLANYKPEDFKRKFDEIVAQWSTYNWDKLTMTWWKNHINTIVLNYKLNIATK